MQDRQIRWQWCVQGWVVAVGNSSVLPDYYAMPWGSGRPLSSLCHEGWHGGSVMVALLPCLLSCVRWLPTPPQPTAFHQGAQKVQFDPHRLPVPPTGTRTKCMSGVSHCIEFLAKLFCVWGYDETNTAPGVFLMESPPWTPSVGRGMHTFPATPSSLAPSALPCHRLHGICISLSTSHGAQRVKNISWDSLSFAHCSVPSGDIWSSLKCFPSPMTRRSDVCGCSHLFHYLSIF